MIKFGNKERFAIWVDYDYIKYKDEPDFIESVSNRKENKMWGSVYFWVNNKNVFAYDDIDPEATYTYWLNIIVEYFSDKMQFHLAHDPFPKLTKATNASDMMDEVCLVELPDNDIQKWADVDWDNIDKELYRKIDQWNWNHGIIAHNDGSFLPDIYSRRVNDQIEISWSNLTPLRSEIGEFYLKHRKGVEYIELQTYLEIISEFCLDFIERFYDISPKVMEKYRQSILNAKKMSL